MTYSFQMMIDTSPWSSCSCQSPWLPCSGHTVSSTGPSVSPFRDFCFRLRLLSTNWKMIRCWGAAAALQGTTQWCREKGRPLSFPASKKGDNWVCERTFFSAFRGNSRAAAIAVGCGSSFSTIRPRRSDNREQRTFNLGIYYLLRVFHGAQKVFVLSYSPKPPSLPTLLLANVWNKYVVAQLDYHLHLLYLNILRIEKYNIAMCYRASPYTTFNAKQKLLQLSVWTQTLVYECEKLAIGLL